MEKKNKHLITVDLPVIEGPSRSLALATLVFGIVKTILLIPHLIILYFLMMAALVVGILAQIIVLFTGKYPPGLFKIVRGTLLWHLRVMAYFMGLTDKYPPFSLE